MKKIVALGVVAALIAIATFILIQKLWPAQQPLKLIKAYKPKGERSPPEFILKGLPQGFHAGIPTSHSITYPDGTHAMMKLLSYSKNKSRVNIQLLNISGEKLIEKTPEAKKYKLEYVKFDGNKIIKYIIPTYEQGYLWNYGEYSITVSCPLVSEKFPSFLEKFAKLYLKKYPSEL